MKNPFPSIGRFFVRTFNILRKLWTRIENLGLDDAVVEEASKFVREASMLTMTNDERREFVIQRLTELFPKLPERVIRIAVEVGVDVLKNGRPASA